MTKRDNLNAYDLAYCALFTALMAVGAWIKIMIPVGVFSVTISLQVFFAIMAGVLLGSRRGLISVLVYLLIGLVGAPVFAHGGGIFYVLKPTFGFLIGLAAAAYFTGKAYETLKTNLSQGRAVMLSALLGEGAYYACGLIYYYIMYNLVLPDVPGIGIVELFSVWCFSTIIPDTVICLLAAQFALRILPLLSLRQEVV